MRELQIANENRRKIKKPAAEDNEQANEAYEHQMRVLMATEDVEEKQESKFAHLQSEQQHLDCELEQLQDRKKNMQLINDQVGGWTKRVASKMQEQLQGMTIQTEERNIVDVLREIATLAKSQLTQIKSRQ